MDLWQSANDALVVRELRVGRYAIDFAVPGMMLAIELDGVFWHSFPESEERDRRKDVFLAAHGWTVRRIPIGPHDKAECLAAQISAVVDELAPRRRSARRRTR